MQTINQILKKLEDTANSHLQVGSFGYGNISDIEANGAKNGLLVWAAIQSSSRNERIRSVTFSLLFMDLVQKDEDNMWEVLSDTELVAYDFLTELNKDENWDDFRISITNTLTPFTERFQNEWYGWATDITFETNYTSDECALPIT